MFNAAGEDVVAGIRTPESIEALRDKRLPEVYDELYQTQALLENHYRDMQDIEFTVQEGRFYMLQTRSRQSAPGAPPSKHSRGYG